MGASQVKMKAVNVPDVITNYQRALTLEWFKKGIK